MNNFINQFPYSDLHELNLDWCIKTVKLIYAQMQDFKKINNIKFADPIEWNIAKQYEPFTIVFDTLNECSYISKQPVPPGIGLSNVDYWSYVGPLLIDGSARSEIETILKFIVNIYESGTTATAIRHAGDYIIVNENLYKVSSTINIGETYSSGINMNPITIETMIHEIISLDIGYVTPEMFGAKGDGTTDDTSAINSAIASSSKVLFTADTYLISNELEIHSNLVLESFINSTIKMKANSPHGFIDADNNQYVTIKNMTFDIDAANQTAKYKTLSFENCSNINLDNVRLEDQYSSVAYNTDGHCHFEDCSNIVIDNCIMHDSAAENLVFINCVDIWVNGGNYYNALNGSAIAITGGTRSHITNVNIANTKGSGISLNSDYSEVKGCTIKNVDTSVPASNGITCGHSRDYNADNSIITNNIIDEAPNGIGTGASYNIIIANNTITNIDGYGIRTVNNSANCSVENNNVSNAVSGILVTSNQSYIGNIVTKCTNGFVMSTATGASLIGNKIFDNTSNGIYDTGTSSKNSYINNECSSTTTPSSQPYGMVLRNTGNVVIGNICKNNGTLNISVPTGNYAFMNVTSDMNPVVNDQYDGLKIDFVNSGSLKTKITDVMTARGGNTACFVSFGSGITDNPFQNITTGFAVAMKHSSYSGSVYLIGFNGTTVETASF